MPLGSLCTVSDVVQVVALLAANVTFTETSVMQCPRASRFVDAFNGLYGSNAYPSIYSYPWNQTGRYNREPCAYLTSTLQFGCSSCPYGTYSLSSGYSNGTAGSGVNPECFPCPYGGVCTGTGNVVAQPGYWGDSSDTGHVNFKLCPTRYCCSSTDTCVSLSSCFGYRAGPLCGDCAVGFSESVDSTSCVPTNQCASSSRLFWGLAIPGIFLVAFLQLVLVSDLLPGVRKSFVQCFRWCGESCRRLWKTTTRVVSWCGCDRQTRRAPSGMALPPTSHDVDDAEGGTNEAAVDRGSADANTVAGAKFKVFTYFTQVRVLVS